MMNVVRVVALVVAIATVCVWSGVAAQESAFTCEDFITQTAAQDYLEKYLNDPYGLDPDGNGIACEQMLANGETDAGSAAEARPVDETESDASVQPERAEATVVPTAKPAPTPTPTPSPGASQSNPAPLGTTLESQGLAVTVDSAYFDFGFANAIPRGGYKVLILGVTIENRSDENRGYEAARFSGIDAMNGNTYDPVTLDNVGVLLTDGDLQPGQFVSGTALIEVQETATNVIIKYDADYLGDEDLYWS
jgi:hypothetical protein